MKNLIAEITLDRESAAPLYRQIYDSVKLGIMDGRILPREHIPGQLELSELISVSLPTVRKAMELLEDDGLIVRRKRAGSFVREKEHWKAMPRLARVGLLQYDIHWAPDYHKGLLNELQRMMSELSLESQTIIFDHKNSESLEDRIQSAQLDGMVCLTDGKLGVQELLQNLSMPCVSVELRIRVPHVDSITIDVFDGMCQATQALIDLGHKDIAFVGGLLKKSGHYTTNDLRWVPPQDLALKVAGYRQAIDAADLPFDRDRVYEIPYDEEPATELVSQWVSENSQPTAILALDDTMAEYIYRALQEQGISVPGDVSLVGFGDFLPDTVPGGLATVAVDWKGMARFAAMRISDRVANGGVSGIVREVDTVFKPGGSIRRCDRNE